MKTKDFYFNLPEELIAQHPCGERGNDRLMHLNKYNGNTTSLLMKDLPDLITPGTVMVFNNSRVRRSRVYGLPLAKDDLNNKPTKKTEFLFIKKLEPQTNNNSVWKAMVKNAKRQKPGKQYCFPDGTIGRIIADTEDSGSEFRTVEFDKIIDENWFEKNGHIPLPPYIKRDDADTDSERYQTVYAKETGSAAAPTAGLHFTEEMLEMLHRKGIEIVYITLHVGLGTFLPVRCENIEEHHMHEESFFISDETAAIIEKAKAEQRHVLAVGTTSLRTLESAWKDGSLRTGHQTTSIFIYPGYDFKVADCLFTNFHTPESTLLMLVSAFAGKENIFNAYKQAINEKYRFFSYGDAMLID